MLKEQLSILRVQKRDWKYSEKAPFGQIKQLKQTISEMDDREKVVDSLPCHIKEQDDPMDKVREALEAMCSRNNHVIHYIVTGFSVLSLPWLLYVL